MKVLNAVASHHLRAQRSIATNFSLSDRPQHHSLDRVLRTRHGHGELPPAASLCFGDKAFDNLVNVLTAVFKSPIDTAR
jgi:hypothetical protein